MSATTDELMRAISDPLRRQIVELLATEQLCTCHLVERTGARQTNLSNHLRVLRDAGLVKTEAAGRYTYYQVRPETLASLARTLSALAVKARKAEQIRRPCP